MVDIMIKSERCKGCSLCIPFCPKNIIKVSEHINSSGYHPVEILNNEICTGCAACAKICPDMAIEILKE